MYNDSVKPLDEKPMKSIKVLKLVVVLSLITTERSEFLYRTKMQHSVYNTYFFKQYLSIKFSLIKTEEKQIASAIKSSSKSF